MNDFYGILFAHGMLSTGKKVKSTTRCYYPNELTFSKRKMIPIFTFGTTGLLTTVDKTILSFMFFVKQFGTEFTDAVASMLLRYGDTYLSRYRLPDSPTIIDKAVAYMVQMNQIEVSYTPQNRFFTFYRREQDPFDFTFCSNKKNETFLLNTPFPTVDLKTNGGKRYYTVNDFLDNSLNLSTDEFKKHVTKFLVNDKKKPIISSFEFLNEMYDEVIENSEIMSTIKHVDYVFPFGICNTVNIFSVVQLGAYGTNYKNERGRLPLLPMLDTFTWNNSNSAEVSLTTIINYFKHYKENYLCKGIFTFSCKSTNPEMFQPNTVLNYQHFQRGIEGLTVEQKNSLEEQKNRQKELLRAKKIVQSRLGRV